MKVARAVWILTKFKRIVRDGKEDAKIEEAQEKLINSAKGEVAKLVKKDTIKNYLSEKEVTYEDNSATVHLKKALSSDELKEINGTGIMTSIGTVFEANENLELVNVSIGDSQIVTIKENEIELAKIKTEIVEKLLREGLNNSTKITLVAKGENLGENGVTYTVKFTVEESSGDNQ